MNQSTISQSWYRVAHLKPQLRSHAEVHRHHYRQQSWYVVQDHSTGRHHRVSPSAYAVIGLMDGVRSVETIFNAVSGQLGDDAPTQEETIRLLSQLHAADLLQCDVTPDSEEAFSRFERHQRAQWKQRLLSPFSLRFPLLDPERALERLAPLCRPLFGWAGAAVWLLVVSSAAVVAASHWSALTEDVLGRVLSMENLFLLWLTYPVVKALHEFGHAMSAKVWGGEVHEAGVMLLVFMPVPYVDASSASAFRDKRQRMLVGAAGIGVELFLAALALFVWIHAEPGMLRAIAYNVMIIGGASTLFFNGNPLLRFDGYYVLADAIEIPNLAARSKKYLGYLVQRHVFGVRDLRSPAMAPGERPWFVVYGIASMVYRLFIMVAIALFVAGKFFVVGVLLAIWAVTSQLLVPLLKGAAFVFTSPSIRRTRLRAVATSVGAIGVVVATVTLVPVPLSTQAEGVIWLPEHSLVRAGSDGFVSQLLAEPGVVVVAGEPLMALDDPFLDARISVLGARLAELEARFTAEWQVDRLQAEITREEISAVRASLERVEERVGELTVRSPIAGRFVVHNPQDLPGRFAHQGDLLAYVLSEGPAIARVVVPQTDIGLVRGRTKRVEVKLSERLADTVLADIDREVPAAGDRLPSVVLGSAGGGSIAVAPGDPQGLQVLESVFQFDIALRGASTSRAGGRVYVRFDHGMETLASQWYRRGQQVFLERFGA